MLSKNCFEPGRSTAFRFNNGAGPECKGLPADVFLVRLVEAIPGNMHQLSAGSATGSVPDPSFELGKLRCLHFTACTLNQRFWNWAKQQRELPQAKENPLQGQKGQKEPAHA